MSVDKHAAHVWIQGDAIHYATRDTEVWKLPIAEVRVIGEYTTPNGPYIDDYFFVFLSADYWYEASFYSEGGLELLPKLSGDLKEELTCGLQNSTNWKSRVIWPPDIKEEPLFDIVPAEMPTKLWDKIKYKMVSPVEFHLTRKVKEKMKAASENHA